MPELAGPDMRHLCDRLFIKIALRNEFNSSVFADHGRDYALGSGVADIGTRNTEARMVGDVKNIAPKLDSEAGLYSDPSKHLQPAANPWS